MNRICKHCGKNFTHEVAANMIVFCPHCNGLAGIECEYGFGPITPCSIYRGEDIIGRIVGRTQGEFRLMSYCFGIDIELKGGYDNLEIYKEAISIIESLLSKESIS